MPDREWSQAMFQSALPHEERSSRLVMTPEQISFNPRSRTRSDTFTRWSRLIRSGISFNPRSRTRSDGPAISDGKGRRKEQARAKLSVPFPCIKGRQPPDQITF